MKKQQYIVFGLNRFGTSVARTLAAAGNEVVAVDQVDVPLLAQGGQLPGGLLVKPAAHLHPANY